MKTKALLPRYHFFWNGIPFPLWAVTGRPSGATERFRTGRSRERSRFAPDAFPPSGVSLGVRVGRPCPVIAFAKYHIQAVPVCQEEIFRPARRVG